MTHTRTNAVDILGIGVQKSATSWAAHVLNLQPRVWFPHEHAFSGKEVSFFSGPKWRKGTAWYQRIMTPPEPEMLSADVSPGYSRVGEHRVRTCHQLAPDARVFLLLRDPVHRDWSSMLMQAKRRNFDVTRASLIDLLVFYDRENITQFTTYDTTIRRWRRYYGDMFIGLYDDIVADPISFYQKLCRYVGLDHDDVEDWRTRVTRRIFSGPDVPLPPDFAEFLRKKHEPMVYRVEGLLQRSLQAWLIDETHRSALTA